MIGKWTEKALKALTLVAGSHLQLHTDIIKHHRLYFARALNWAFTVITDRFAWVLNYWLLYYCTSIYTYLLLICISKIIHISLIMYLQYILRRQMIHHKLSRILLQTLEKLYFREIKKPSISFDKYVFNSLNPNPLSISILKNFNWVYV